MFSFLTVSKCLEPPSVTGAFKNGSLFEKGSLVKYQCIPGKFFERNKTQIEIKCMNDSSWSTDPNSLRCFGKSKSDFQYF